MKVLHILNELRYSGAEVMLTAAIPYFVNAGIESHVLATGASVGDYAPILKEAGYSITHIPFAKNVFFFVRVAEYVRHNKFDIVHIHTDRGAFWYACTAWACGVNTIIRTIHSSFSFTRFLRFRRTVQRSIMRSVFGVTSIAISEGVKDVEETVFHNSCLLIRNWIDQRRLFPAKDDREKDVARTALGIPTDSFVLLSVGSCERVKNHSAIIEALLGLDKAIKYIFYLHVGTGPLEESEQRLVKDMGMDSKVLFAGQLNDVRQALIASDIFVMPSLYEGLGNTILESFATGIPVIAYDVKGINSVIENGSNGLLCSRTSAQLADAVLRLHGDPTLRNTIIGNAYDTMCSSYSTDESLAKLLHLYTSKDEALRRRDSRVPVRP